MINYFVSGYLESLKQHCAHMVISKYFKTLHPLFKQAVVRKQKEKQRQKEIEQELLDNQQLLKE